MKKQFSSIVLIAFVLFTQSFHAQHPHLTLDPVLESKITQLLAKMSLEEKVGQTCQITLDALLATDATGKVLEPLKIDPIKLKEAIVSQRIGSILNVSSHTLKMEEWRTIMQAVHAPFREGIVKAPILYGADAIHGVNYTVGGTLFPQEIGLAATWNRDLAEQFGRVTAYELRASGIPWNFSPVMDLGRQPLWSRYFETLGEDPYLVAEMGKRIIAGYQGTSLSDKYSTLSCLKHFVGYSFPLSGRDRTPAWIPENYMQELFLPPFKATVDAGALSVMVNSGEVNGIPGHQNQYLLTEILKEKWGFKGFAVSDWEDIIMLETVHTTAANQKAAIVSAINAGLDMSMVPNSPQYKEYTLLLKEAVEESSVSMTRLDDAVRRILRAKYLLGLFENQTYPLEQYGDFSSEKFKSVAKQAAAESVTLVKNTNNLLPLKKGQKILVAGPTADNLIYLNGAWSHTWQGVDTAYNTKGCSTVLEAIQQVNGAKNTLFSKAVSLNYVDGWESCSTTDIKDFDKKACKSDVIVLCLGELPATEKPGDIRSLDLPKEQMELVERALATKKPVILVLLEGRPRIIHDVVANTSAILQAYLPGDYGADAISGILFGDINPSGKLPYSYPKYSGVIEHYDLKKSEMRSGKTNQFDAYDPEWNFGFGLSYSTFAYSAIRVDKTTFVGKDSIVVSVDVKNTSSIKGKEVVQLYVTDLVSSTATWGKRLKNYTKIELAPDEVKTVNFVLSEKDIMFVGRENNWTSESGEFEINIGSQRKRINYIK